MREVLRPASPGGGASFLAGLESGGLPGLWFLVSPAADPGIECHGVSLFANPPLFAPWDTAHAPSGQAQAWGSGLRSKNVVLTLWRL